MDWHEAWDRFVCLLYPPRCLVCGEVVAYDDWVCRDKPECAIQPDIWHGWSGKIEVVSPCQYVGEVKNVIYTIKGDPAIRPFQFFSHYMLQAARDHLDCAFNCIVPVPSSQQVMRARGFNQAQILAKYMSRGLRAPIETGLLHRSGHTTAQHLLSAEERWANARNSYSLAPGAATRHKRILLVDDVLTTGATVEVCSQLLLEAGAQVVCAAVATHTLLQPQDPQAAITTCPEGTGRSGWSP